MKVKEKIELIHMIVKWSWPEVYDFDRAPVSDFIIKHWNRGLLLIYNFVLNLNF